MKKRILGCLLAGFLSLSAVSQVSSTLSPYSQFGIGALAEQSQGFNRGMAGLSIGMRGGNVVNMQNPASYSAVDSLTMIFDVGVSGQLNHFTEGGTTVNTKTGNFDYAVTSFRLLRNLGLSAGVVPYSNIGYNYYNSDYIGNSATYMNEIHEGSGGFSQVFLGVGWRIFKGFSAGVNVSYFWGDWERSVTVVNSDSYVNTVTKNYDSEVTSYKLDFGLQWQQRLGKEWQMTLGAIYGLGHSLGNSADMTVTNLNKQTSEANIDVETVGNALSIPHTFGAGVSLTKGRGLTFGADYTMQKWAELSYPAYSAEANSYRLTDGLLRDRHKVVVGADWIPNPQGRKSLLQHIHYRIGASYATPYYKIKGGDGPKELTVSAGFGVPVINSWNNRSVLNISASWVRTAAPGMLVDNSFRLSLGLTFNERWFAKWKVD